MKKTIFVVGAGTGLGNAVARKFAANDFRVVLMSRSAQHLEAYQKEMEAQGIEAAAQVVDTADQAALSVAMKQAVDTYGIPDVLFYNVGIVVPDQNLPGGMTTAVMEQRYQAEVLGAYTCIRQVLGEEFGRKQGAILVTGGGFAMYPSADFLPLSMDKAALRAMVLALHPVCKQQGVYLGAVQVCGTIGGSEKYMPEKIAEQFWTLYQSRTDAEIIY
ncbi:SDR family NAD(P)-dependent oxidoreductase [Pseudoflavonifractor phocaeensis]|uniref:SDR family NAD(P)-dependent oxidoreductase n=1 Tax=Pseudoflavonifractor phocaeensis TaxID=1870988 RepID=UPI00195C4690|nr:SDR family NAD(P)-dependent oxidoreductase [Pseudoflavonifractor phocaeensis]MBM6927175.1 SDR family NAD(P)-dependent oxidoreductase [Pseudoflavonifractor phocaeensis]